jgi:NodT family efflux transporter outer membrane factor (OMF) lipoprotein
VPARVERAAPAATTTWWRQLDDPAIDALALQALSDSPTLAQAMARLDEARAALGLNRASGFPAVTAQAGATRSRDLAGAAGGDAVTSTSGSAGLSLSWEIDLFGRVRGSVAAAQARLDARTADAQMARLSLVAQVADTVLALHACDHAVAVQMRDIASRETTYALTERRRAVGFAPSVDVARAASGLADARTQLANRHEACMRQVNALSALTGLGPSQVRRVVATAQAMPVAPEPALQAPAILLASQPQVVAAEREAAAAWEEVGVARAERLPRLSLAAVLTGQWIRAGGSTLDDWTGSAGPSLSMPLLDGGAGRANVAGARARYDGAVGVLRQTVRDAARDVEDALAAGGSAQLRLATSRDAVAAAQQTLDATDAQWRAGAVSLFELEDARRQFAAAQDNAIAAARDAAQAWVGLIRATGALPLQEPST